MEWTPWLAKLRQLPTTLEKAGQACNLAVASCELEIKAPAASDALPAPWDELARQSSGFRLRVHFENAAAVARTFDFELTLEGAVDGALELYVGSAHDDTAVLDLATGTIALESDLGDESFPSAKGFATFLLDRMESIVNDSIAGLL